MSIEAMKLALEALENPWKAKPEGVANAITALRQAIEQAEKQCQCPACKIKPHASDCSVHNEPAWPNGPCDCGAVEQAQKQEPVAYINVEKRRLEFAFDYMKWDTPTTVELGRIPLFTSPPQRKPLTDEEILAIARDHYNLHQQAEISFARAIEAKLKEKNT